MSTFQHTYYITLGLIITQDTSSPIPQTLQGSLLLDHNIIHYKLQTPDRIITLKEISYRKLKAINMDHLKENISKIPHHGDCNSPDKFLQLYKNMHAPLKKKLVSNKPKVPWFNDTIAAEIMKRKRLEKIWQNDINNTGKYVHLHKQRRKVSNIIDCAEKTHLQENS